MAKHTLHLQKWKLTILFITMQYIPGQSQLFTATTKLPNFLSGSAVLICSNMRVSLLQPGSMVARMILVTGVSSVVELLAGVDLLSPDLLSPDLLSPDLLSPDLIPVFAH